VEPGAAQDKVRKAFRRRAAATHPDKGGSTAEFVELQEAVAAARLFWQ
jgi:curved DNA-binding protein CbpA